MRRSTWWAIGGGAIGVVYVATMIFVLASFFLEDVREYQNRIPFNSASWKADQDTENPLRIRMVDDLLAKNDFHGAAKAEIVALLGEPDHDVIFTDRDLPYRLGPERDYFSLDTEWLVFRLNLHDDVIDYAIMRD